MKQLIIVYFSVALLLSCNNNSGANNTQNSTNINAAQDTAANFFPVTAFLKGEVNNIKTGGVTPLKKITIGNHTDSTWLKMDSIEIAVSDFLSPIIDSANLKKTFTEKKFLDQTINAFTFSYDPIDASNNNFLFKHWDVYVDPDKNIVKRIYLIKTANDGKTLQLTWQTGKWCKIVTIATIDGADVVVKEEKILWNFDEQ
ncbi:hypothetical protein ACFOWM_06380 [Ferruginibacter yonginensis]|uniref:Lipoprotein n=1 Tax=Ferruginibacter yonginensis TaxID=1310416 RepID=A0ABV8QQW8_9BACT